MIVISFVSNDLIQMIFEYKRHDPLFFLDLLFSCPIIIPRVRKHVFHKLLTPLRFYKAPVKPSLNIAWLVFAFNIHSGCTSHYIKQWIMALSILCLTSLSSVSIKPKERISWYRLTIALIPQIWYLDKGDCTT